MTVPAIDTGTDSMNSQRGDPQRLASELTARGFQAVLHPAGQQPLSAGEQSPGHSADRADLRRGALWWSWMEVIAQQGRTLTAAECPRSLIT